MAEAFIFERGQNREVVEDITSKEVSKYRYALNFNPKMWIPVTVETVD